MTRALLIAAATLIVSGGIAYADDHLFQAEQHGLSAESQASAHSQAIENAEEAPGQGSPFTGEETKTPATATAAANEHANVKQRAPE
jgi:hypothetical protein